MDTAAQKEVAVKPAKPVPHANELSQPYWDGLTIGVLSLQCCVACGKFRHYPRLICDQCYSLEVKQVAASGRGVIHSWTVAHHPFHPGFAEDLPYVLAVVDLDEGVRAMGRLHHVAADEIRLGLPVQFVPEKRDDGITLPTFVPR